MQATRSELHDLVERIPEVEIPIAQRFLQFLSQEPIGPKFAESIRRGIAQADEGQSIICDCYAEMVEKQLGKE